MFKALARLFGFGGAPCCAAKNAGNADTQLRDLENFVDYVVKALVDYPDEVSVASAAGAEGTTITITCRKEDIGKVVGKKGKTIMAIRSLVSGAAGRFQKRVAVEVAD